MTEFENFHEILLCLELFKILFQFLLLILVFLLGLLAFFFESRIVFAFLNHLNRCYTSSFIILCRLIGIGAAWLSLLLLFLFRRFLFLTKVSVRSIRILLKQCIVVSLLREYAIDEYHDFVCVLNSRQPMRYHDNSQITLGLTVPVNRILHNLLIHFVEC